MQVAIYVRVSTDGQAEGGTSLETQEAACRRYAVDHNMEVTEVYSESFSGYTRERPLLTKLREQVRSHAVQTVVVYAIDRLSRNQTDLAILLDEAERHRCQIACVTEPLEATAIGKFMLNARAFVAEVEREKIKERTVRGKRARVQAGKIHRHGPELYGYLRNKDAGVRVIYEPEAAIVRLIFRWIGEGMHLRSVVSRLNAETIASPSVGKMEYRDRDRPPPRWGKPQVTRMLRNPAYKGEAIAWRWKHNSKHENSSPRPESEWIRLPEGVTPAIVAADLWDAAQRVLDANLAADATRNEARPYLLRGHVYCAVCGRRMRSEPEHGKRIYRCSSRHTAGGACGASRVSADKVEAWTWDQLTCLLRDPAMIAAEVQRQREPDTSLTTDRDAVRRRLERVVQQQERLISRFRHATEDDPFPWDLVEREIIRAETEKKQLQATLAEIDGRISDQRATAVQLDALTAYCERVAANLDTFGFEEKRLALHALGVRVIADGKRWEIQGTVPMTGDAGVLNNTP